MDDGGKPDVARLVDLYLGTLYGYAFRLCGSDADAEDLVQETFLIAQQKLGQLRDRRAELAWLMKILQRCWWRQCRRLPVDNRIPVEEILDATSAAESSSADFEVDVEQLMAVLNAMPAEYREPLILFYFRELRYREIADVLGCPIGTVMSRLARGKAYLRSRLVPEQVNKEPC